LVQAPDRLLRVWALLSAASEELHKVKLPRAAVPLLHPGRRFRAG